MTQPTQESPLRPIQLLALLGCLLAGVASALLLMPTLFRHIPTDISRIGVLLDALEDPAQRPEIAILGNSVMMSGIDAEQLSAELPGKPLAWNLASTGQSMVESAMLTQELPTSVGTAIYTAHLLTNPEVPPLLPVKNNAFHLYGWRPTHEMRHVLEGIYGEGVPWLFDRPHLSQLFQARWALRQFLDTRLRILLRTDLDLAGAEGSLFHPQRYAVPMSHDVLERTLADGIARLSLAPPEMPARDRELVRILAVRATQLGRRTVVLIPPIHPAEFAAHTAAFRAATDVIEAALVEAPNTIVIDATTALESSQFIDDLHPTNDGARILTSLVAARIREGF